MPEVTWIAVGSGGELTASLARHVSPLVVLGRKQPSFPVSRFFEIGDLTNRVLRQQAADQLGAALRGIDSEVHILLTQGLSTADWEEALAVNLTSVGEMCAVILEHEPAVGSSVTLVGSATAYLGGKMPYAASKAGLTGVMASVNQKGRGRVRCNLVVPGAFEGAMTADWDADKRALVAGNTDIGRLATADEIVHGIVAMATNPYAAGVRLNLTGGQVPMI